MLVLMLVVGFKSSGNLAAAYGIAVTGMMLITACMFGVLTFSIWRWNPVIAGTLTGIFLIIDGLYFASNLTKIPDGGWFPLLVAGVTFTLLTTWGKGRKLMHARVRESAMSLELFAKSAKSSVERVSGTAVFLSSTQEGVPPALLHNLKHNKVIHQRVIAATIAVAKIPHVTEADRLTIVAVGKGFFRATIHGGFIDMVDEAADISRAGWAEPVKLMDTSFFLSRQTLIASDIPGMAIWREKLFAWMMRNAESAMDYFKLPTNRVVELGSQVEI